MSTAEDERRNKKWLDDEVNKILGEEADGDGQAFSDWLHTFYLGALDGERLEDFEVFLKSPLTLDMIADWRNECGDRASRVELLGHIVGLYTAEDFDEPEHYNAAGSPTLPYGDPGDKHYDERGNVIPPYVPSWQRGES